MSCEVYNQCVYIYMEICGKDHIKYGKKMYIVRYTLERFLHFIEMVKLLKKMSDYSSLKMHTVILRCYVRLIAEQITKT